MQINIGINVWNPAKLHGDAYFNLYLHERNAMTGAQNPMLGAAVKVIPCEVEEGTVLARSFEVTNSVLERYPAKSRTSCEKGIIRGKK